MRVQVEFLTLPGSIELEVPSHLMLPPEAVTTVSLNGAPRTLVYSPSQWASDPDDAENLVHVRDVEHEGITVRLYQQREEPRFYVAGWRLSDGFLITFMGEPTSDVAVLEYVVRRIHVTQRAGSLLPKVRLEAPLGRGDVKSLEQRDQISFPAAHPTDTQSAVLVLHEEPRGNGRSKASARSMDPSTTEVSLTLSGVRLSSIGPERAREELRAELEAVADGIRMG